MLRIVAVLALAAPAFAGTVSHTLSVPPLHNYDSITVQAPGFDHSLGHLDSITFTGTLSVSGSLAFENVEPYDLFGSVTGAMYVYPPVGTAGFSAPLCGAVPAFDGTLDYAGASGVSGALSGSTPWTTNGPADLATYNQPTVSLTFSALPTIYIVPDDVWGTLHPDVWATVTATLTYNYSSYPESFCNGGAATGCPCGTTPPWAFGYGCLNSGGTAGALWALPGLPSLSGTLGLQVDHLLPATMGLLFEGTQANYAGSVFGDGVRCVGGATRRLGVQQATQGSMYFQVRGIGLGYRCYQVWYRDAANFCTAAPFNLTSAVGTVWVP